MKKIPDDIDYNFTMVTIGETSVGKSCILDAFVKQTKATDKLTTVGVEFKHKTVEVDKLKIKLKICDTAGQEKYRNMTLQYYRNAKGILIVYDITSPITFHILDFWIEQIKNNTTPESMSLIIVGNKSDLKDDRKVTYAQGREYAEKNGVKFFETSAFENININEAFIALIREMIAKEKKAEIEKKKEQNKAGSLDINMVEKKKKSWC